MNSMIHLLSFSNADPLNKTEGWLAQVAEKNASSQSNYGSFIVRIRGAAGVVGTLFIDAISHATRGLINITVAGVFPPYKFIAKSLGFKAAKSTDYNFSAGFADLRQVPSNLFKACILPFAVLINPKSAAESYKQGQAEKVSKNKDRPLPTPPKEKYRRDNKQPLKRSGHKNQSTNSSTIYEELDSIEADEFEQLKTEVDSAKKTMGRLKEGDPQLQVILKKLQEQEDRLNRLQKEKEEVATWAQQQAAEVDRLKKEGTTDGKPKKHSKGGSNRRDETNKASITNTVGRNSFFAPLDPVEKKNFGVATKKVFNDPKKLAQTMRGVHKKVDDLLDLSDLGIPLTANIPSVANLIDWDDGSGSAVTEPILQPVSTLSLKKHPSILPLPISIGSPQEELPIPPPPPIQLLDSTLSLPDLPPPTEEDFLTMGETIGQLQTEAEETMLGLCDDVTQIVSAASIKLKPEHEKILENIRNASNHWALIQIQALVRKFTGEIQALNSSLTEEIDTSLSEKSELMKGTMFQRIKENPEQGPAAITAELAYLNLVLEEVQKIANEKKLKTSTLKHVTPKPRITDSRLPTAYEEITKLIKKQRTTHNPGTISARMFQEINEIRQKQQANLLEQLELNAALYDDDELTVARIAKYFSNNSFYNSLEDLQAAIDNFKEWINDPGNNLEQLAPTDKDLLDLVKDLNDAFIA